jgi:glucuronate isomerase
VQDSPDDQQIVIPQIVDSGIIRKCVTLFQSPKTTDTLKFEIAWIFTNLTMGKTEQLVILKNCGVLSALISHVKLFKGKYREIMILCIDY